MRALLHATTRTMSHVVMAARSLRHAHTRTQADSHALLRSGPRPAGHADPGAVQPQSCLSHARGRSRGAAQSMAGRGARRGEAVQAEAARTALRAILKMGLEPTISSLGGRRLIQ